MKNDYRGYIQLNVPHGMSEPDFLKLIAREVYMASQPKGMGIIHYRSGGLDSATEERLLEKDGYWRGGDTVLDMDYVHGRQCKFTVYRHGESLFCYREWGDHSRREFENLLARIRQAPDRATASDLIEEAELAEQAKFREHDERLDAIRPAWLRRIGHSEISEAPLSEDERREIRDLLYAERSNDFVRNWDSGKIGLSRAGLEKLKALESSDG